MEKGKSLRLVFFHHLFIIKATSGCHPERSARNARVANDLLSECAKRTTYATKRGG